MKNKGLRKVFASLAAASLLAAGANAQSSSGGGLAKGMKDQWEIGASIGNTYIQPGEMNPDLPNLGYGVYFRKSLGYLFSFKGGLNYTVMSGWNTEKVTADIPKNYECHLWEVTSMAVISLNNLSFINKANSRWNFYGEFGFSINGYNTRTDLIDSKTGKFYDIPTSVYYFNTPNGLVKRSDHEIIDDLKKIMDGTKETWVSIKGAGNAQEAINVYLTGGFGADYKINSKWVVGLEQRYLFSRDDAMDGWQTLQSTKDITSWTNIHVGYLLGKNKATPRWYTNPLEDTYKQIEDAVKKIDDATKDSDGDGIADKFDKDNTTPPGAIVNSKGQTLDSDGDKIPDYLDTEPFSEPGAKVDAKGKAENSTRYATKADIDAVNKKIDEFEPGIVPGPGPNGGGGAGTLPIVNFESSSDYIASSQVTSVYRVAKVMKENPNIKIEVIGYADEVGPEKPNDNLGQLRANAVAKMLTEKFGISKDRLVPVSKGEKETILKYGQGYKPEIVNKINRRVEFRVVK
jgi:outer membrane protein OmpA-like peptidoglycan-associated protein